MVPNSYTHMNDICVRTHIWATLEYQDSSVVSTTSGGLEVSALYRFHYIP